MLSRTAPAPPCLRRVCNGRTPGGPAFPGGRPGRRTEPRSLLSPHRVQRERGQSAGSYARCRPAIQGILRLVAIHLAAGVGLLASGGSHSLRNILGNFHQQIGMIKRVHVPQIDHSH